MAGISDAVGQDRENELATFQAATGLEDIETSITVLEQHGWNLAEAINSIMPQSYSVDESCRNKMEGGSTAPVFSSSGGSSAPSNSSSSSRKHSLSTTMPHPSVPKEVIINFVWDDGSLPLAIPVNQKIGQIKQDLRHLLNWSEENKLTISMEQGSESLNDELTVEQLSLGAEPDGRLLYVSSKVNSILPTYHSATNNGLHHLTVYLNNRPVELKLSPTATIEELKKQASNVCGVSAELQKWVGWPSGLPDHTLLQDAGLLHGEHQLKLESVNRLTAENVVAKLSIGGNSRTNRALSPADSTSSGSDHEYTSAQSDDDDFEAGLDSPMIDTVQAAPPMAPMIPPDCTNPLEALNSFTHQFANRYGPVHPMFFIGSLADAVKEATGGLAATRKPLLLYLHHDRSILSNVFCSQLLCSESIVNYLSLNFICWGWDLTTTQLRDQLLDMVRESFGPDAARNVMAVEPDNLPIILIVFKSKGKVEVRNVIQGFTEVDLMMAAMILAVEEHQLAIEQDSAEEQQRIVREKMIMEQDRAYQESLAQDKQKAQRAEQEQLAKERAAQAKLQQAMKEEEEKKLLEEQLPAEPDTGVKDVSTIRLRCPNGASLIRRFRGDDKLELLFMYTGSKGYGITEYKLLSSFPRRDITTLDGSMTFKQAKLFPQETLFVEERTD